MTVSSRDVTSHTKTAADSNGQHPVPGCDSPRYNRWPFPYPYSRPTGFVSAGRAFTAGNTRQFAEALGAGLRDAFDAPDADPLALGLLAQSLYAGLLMHGAFLEEVDADLFATAYETLAAGTRAVSRRRASPASRR